MIFAMIFFLCLVSIMFLNQTKTYKNSVILIPLTIVTYNGILGFIAFVTSSVLIGQIFLLLSILLLGFRERENVRSVLLTTIAWSICLIALFLLINFHYLSYDTYRQLLYSSQIATEMEVRFLANWGLYYIAAHGGSQIFGLDYFPLINPLALLGILLVLGQHAWRKVQKKEKLKFFQSTSLIALLISTPLFLFHGIYFHNNLISSYGFIVFFSFATISIKGDKFRRDWHLMLLAILLLIIGLMRTENPLVGAFFLLSLLSHLKLKAKIEYKLWSIFSIPLIIWYLTLLVNIDEATILSPSRILIQISILTSGFGLIYLKSSFDFLEKLSRFFDYLLLSALLGVYALFSITQPGHLTTSIHSIYQNIFNFHGGYAYSFWIASALLLLSIGIRKNKAQKFLLLNFLNYAIFIVVISSFRAPYRIGVGDSANRIALQLLPSIFLYLQSINWTKNPIRIPALNPIGILISKCRRFNSSLLYSLGLLILLLPFFPFDLSSNASILKSNNMLKPSSYLLSNKGTYAEEKKLRYSQANSGGEREIIFDLGKSEKISAFGHKNIEGNKKYKLICFTWHASKDNILWDKIYSSFDPTPEPLNKVDFLGINYIISNSTEKYRYLKLTSYKTTGWQSRFGLRKVYFFQPFNPILILPSNSIKPAICG